MKSEMWFVVPSISAIDAQGNMLVHLYEGTGDNLLPEDRAEGYIDYLNYETYIYDRVSGNCTEDDGGMVMLKSYVSDITDREGLALLSAEIFEGEDAASYITPENITEIDPSQLIGLDY